MGKPISRDPIALEDIKARRLAGETLAEIGETYGLCREYIRQICKKAGVVPGPMFSLEEMQRIKQRCFEEGSVDAVAQELQISFEKLKREGLNCGADLIALAAEGRLTQLKSPKSPKGQVFGDWTVIGDEVQWHRSRKGRVYSVECQCVCGTKKMVPIRNLEGRMSNGCGCRNNSKRIRVPWICEQTGERFPNSKRLAIALGLNPLTLTRHMRISQSYRAADGRIFRALVDEAVQHQMPYLVLVKD